MVHERKPMRTPVRMSFENGEYPNLISLFSSLVSSALFISLTPPAGNFGDSPDRDKESQASSVIPTFFVYHPKLGRLVLSTAQSKSSAFNMPKYTIYTYHHVLHERIHLHRLLPHHHHPSPPHLPTHTRPPAQNLLWQERRRMPHPTPQYRVLPFLLPPQIESDRGAIHVQGEGGSGERKVAGAWEAAA